MCEFDFELIDERRKSLEYSRCSSKFSSAPRANRICVIKLCFFVASLRNFGERTANLFRRKKNTAEQNAQDLANQTEEAAVSLKNDLKNDTNEVAENAGYYLLSSSKKKQNKKCLLYLSIN